VKSWVSAQCPFGPKNGGITLHYAAWIGDIDSIEKHIENGTDVDKQDDNGWTALQLAVWNRHTKVVELLRGISSISVNTKNREGKNAAQLAADNEDDPSMRMLISAGGSPNEPYSRSPLSLHSAARQGDFIESLIASGVDLSAPVEFRHIAMHLAAEGGHVDTIDGMKRTLQPLGGWTPLLYAVKQDKIDAIRNLNDLGVDISDSRGYPKSPIHYAASWNKCNAIQILSELGADPSTRDVEEKTPLHYAAADGSILAIKTLLELRVNIEVQDKDGRTPMHYASFSGLIQPIETLIQFGSDISVKDKFGATPIHNAAAGAGTDVIELLKSKGCDVSVQDNRGMTAMHIAAIHGRLDIIEALKKMGADASTRDIHGRTAMAILKKALKSKT
jgi:serine/threonine-protein phosphatase 6 regulatory ankyrin repeat subunit B